MSQYPSQKLSVDYSNWVIKPKDFSPWNLTNINSFGVTSASDNFKESLVYLPNLTALALSPKPLALPYNLYKSRLYQSRTSYINLTQTGIFSQTEIPDHKTQRFCLQTSVTWARCQLSKHIRQRSPNYLKCLLFQSFSPLCFHIRKCHS